MKKVHPLNSHLIFCSLLSSVLVLLIGCKNNQPNKSEHSGSAISTADTVEKPDDYNHRVKNIEPYLTMQKINILKPTDLYLLQVDKCNACNRSNLEEIYNLQKRSKNELIFMLTSNNSEIKKIVTEKFKRMKYNLYVDSTKEVSRLGLSFIKNLHVTIDSGKVQKWIFLE